MALHCAGPAAPPLEPPDSMPIVVSPTRSSARTGLIHAALLVLAIKFAWLTLDPTVRVFLGDSGTYLHTAISDWIPPDRSFLYGWLIGAVAVPAQSIHALLMLQTLFGALAALLLYAWLAFGLGVRASWATIAAGMFALEPAQLFYERMIMAEATGFLCFALFFCAISLYVATGRWRWILAYALLGVLAVAFRISMLAVVLTLSVIAPLVRPLSAAAPDRGRPLLAILRTGVHLAIAVACTVGAHDYYKRWYGELTGVPPGYTANAGIFRLGLVAPLVRPEHFRNSGVPPEALHELTIDHRDHRSRESQIWMEGGLLEVMRRHTRDLNTAARKISIKAVRDDPFGLVRLGFLTVSDYFDPAVAHLRLQDDMGRRELHAALLQALRQHLRYDATDIHLSTHPATRWFGAGQWWFTACLLLLAPIALLALWLGWREPARELRLLLALTSLGLVMGHVLFSHIVSYRYLHPLPWFVIANVALLCTLWLNRRRVRGAGRPSSANWHS